MWKFSKFKVSESLVALTAKFIIILIYVSLDTIIQNYFVSPLGVTHVHISYKYTHTLKFHYRLLFSILLRTLNFHFWAKNCNPKWSKKSFFTVTLKVRIKISHLLKTYSAFSLAANYLTLLDRKPWLPNWVTRALVGG